MKRFLLPQINLGLVISLLLVFLMLGCGGGGSSTPTAPPPPPPTITTTPSQTPTSIPTPSPTGRNGSTITPTPSSTGTPTARPTPTSTPTPTPWTKQLGSSGEDAGEGVAVDSNGNIYVTGYTTGALDGNTNAGGFDIFLVKYNSTGIKQWTRQLGTSSEEKGMEVAVDSSGNIYVTGYTRGGLDGNMNAGGEDIFLVKYDSSGAKIWTRQLGSISDDRGYGIIVDVGSASVFVTGYTIGALDGNTSAGGIDIFLVRYNLLGEKQWTRQLGSSEWDWGRGIAVDSGGNLYVIGETYGGLDGNTNAGLWDIILVKYNYSSGNKIWTRQLGTSGNDLGGGVTVDGSGNVYVNGYTEGALDGNMNNGFFDIFLIKYNPTGVKQWSSQMGSTNDDFGRGVVAGGSNVYLAGTTRGGLDGNSNPTIDDICLFKFNSSGTRQWTRQMRIDDSQECIGVAIDSIGNIYVTGYTLKGFDGNTGAGGQDMFLVKFDSAGVKQ